MASLAHVARVNRDQLEYLLGHGDGGLPLWAASPVEAALFENLREATRAAMRLPSRERAFALPDIAAA